MKRPFCDLQSVSGDPKDVHAERDAAKDKSGESLVVVITDRV